MGQIAAKCGHRRDSVGAGQQLGMPEPVAGASKHYLDTQDPLVEWVKMCCEQDDTTEERPFSDWYWSFRAQSGRSERQATTAWFGKGLEKHKFTKRATSKGPQYTGPKLLPEAVAAACVARDQATYTMEQKQALVEGLTAQVFGPDSVSEEMGAGRYGFALPG